jgi:hypothetical protein
MIFVLLLTRVLFQQAENAGTESEQLGDVEDNNSNYSHEFISRRGLYYLIIGF